MTILMPTNQQVPSQKKQKKQLPKELNYRLLDRELDRVKSRVFLGTNAAFLGPLMCSMNFIWSCDINTACTNGITLLWNPRFFLKTKPKVRGTVLLHELWHPALLHMLRRGTRDPLIWNYAGDIVINNILDSEGHSFDGLKPWLDRAYDGMTTEEVYDVLIQKRDEELQELLKDINLWGYKDEETGEGDQGDIEEGVTIEDQKSIEHAVINAVVSAAHSATISGGAGNMPGEVQLTLKKFLSPKLPWDQILHAFFNQLANLDYSWARPNRRYPDIYLPSLMNDQSGLDHVVCFEDVSGSISDSDMIRFNSEFKHIKDTYQPEKLTLIQFDEILHCETEYLKDDPFDEVLIEGRGGTSLVLVRDWIIRHEPTAVVVFSDLQCDPMDPLPQGLNIPIIWVALNNRDAKVAQGQIVHLHE
jgi:predicted metal-dependent peptidase